MVNTDLDITVHWTMFLKIERYVDDEEGKSDEILGQGTLFNRRALERGDISWRNRHAMVGCRVILTSGGRIIGAGECSLCVMKRMPSSIVTIYVFKLALSSTAKRVTAYRECGILHRHQAVVCCALGSMARRITSRR